MSSFSLNKDIFNPSLYQNIQNVWFQGLSPDARDIDMSVAKRWFMLQAEERDAFDSTCRNAFARALESIGPEQLPSPTAEPFLREIEDIAQRNPANDQAKASQAALSIVILLDQMSRNIYRTNDGLKKVYTHYDKIAFSLVDTVLSSKSPIPRPDLHPSWRLSSGYRQWFYMPLMHSEDIEAHRKAERVIMDLQEELKGKEGYEKMVWFVGMALKSETEHKEIIEKFGRYPHRNGALGRETTSDEQDFMTAGGATFGVSQDK